MATSFGNEAAVVDCGASEKNGPRTGPRTYIKQILPRPIVSKLLAMRLRLALRAEYRQDRKRYAHYSLPGEVGGSMLCPKNLEAQLIKDYHRVEKGLALPSPKRPFGAAVDDRLRANIALGMETGADQSVLQMAATARSALQQWNVDGTIAEEIAPAAECEGRGVTDADVFFRTRRSVRDFADAEVATETLNHAVRLALQSPSVCNRQAWMVRFFRGKDVSRVLAYQNGNNGFTHVVPAVGLVTVDARLFAAPGERNQPWIEGGIFSMSLVWALHALGLDSCMLNMSVRNATADAVRREFGLADFELIIMMIAIGSARDGHRVARSPRRSVDEICPRVS